MEAPPLLDRLRRATQSSHGVARLGVVLCVVCTLGFGIVYFAKAVDQLGDDAARNAATNYDDREFGGGNSVVPEKRALYEARAVIPEDETYRVVTGPRLEGGTELTGPYLEVYVRSFLMPRLPATDADWILCYGCELSELGVGADVVWRGEGGVALARTKR